MEITHSAAAAVRAELARRGLTQTDAAVTLGLSQPAFSRRLVGHVDFSVTEVVALAKWFGIPASTLLDEAPAAALPTQRAAS